VMVLELSHTLSRTPRPSAAVRDVRRLFLEAVHGGGHALAMTHRSSARRALASASPAKVRSQPIPSPASAAATEPAHIRSKGGGKVAQSSSASAVTAAASGSWMISFAKRLPELSSDHALRRHHAHS